MYVIAKSTQVSLSCHIIIIYQNVFIYIRFTKRTRINKFSNIYQ